ncbi:MAG TPA: type II toxin-antitoxin system PemK/MazF family toxin [Actinomycetota bacterium]
MVARGEVWWYEHPDAGRRPFLILTRTPAIAVLERIMAIPATRTIREIPTEVFIGRDDGMPAPCVLTLDNITTIRKSLCTERITALSAGRMQSVCEALAVAAGC